MAPSLLKGEAGGAVASSRLASHNLLSQDIPMSFLDLGAGVTACLIATLGLTGCFVESGAAPAPAQPSVGSVSLASSIEGGTRPSACDEVGAIDLELIVFAGADAIATVTASCDAFDLVTSLSEGTYGGQVTLLDGHSRAVSTTLELSNLNVIAGTDLQVAIDFPVSSILP